jgi:hypothetical protein
MKENNGRARRRAFAQKARLTVIGSCFATLVVMALLAGDLPSVNQTREASRHLQKSLRHRVQSIKDRLATKHEVGAAAPDHEAAAGATDNDDDDDELAQILAGHLQLMDVQVHRDAKVHDDGSYEGIVGAFCPLQWEAHKRDPAATPMFRDVIGHSAGCDEPFLMDLQTVMEHVSEYDESATQAQAEGGNTAKTHLMDLKGVAFHESRCGSTLVANLMQAMDPAAHRVYSESGPPIHALRLADKVGTKAAATVLQDVIYLMSRTADPLETTVFFKIQSIGSTYLPVFLEAFPDTPYIFVYRDPVQVMVSHFSHGIHNANCVQGQRRPTHLVQEIVAKRPQIKVHAQDLDPEDFCAAHLAGITETAVAALTDGPNPNGQAVNYRDMPARLYDEVFPQDWGLDVTPEALERMKTVAGVYSKGRGAAAGSFTGDNAEKEAEATDAMREAAAVFLKDSYDKLEALG